MLLLSPVGYRFVNVRYASRILVFFKLYEVALFNKIVVIALKSWTIFLSHRFILFISIQNFEVSQDSNSRQPLCRSADCQYSTVDWLSFRRIQSTSVHSIP